MSDTVIVINPENLRAIIREEVQRALRDVMLERNPRANRIAAVEREAPQTDEEIDREIEEKETRGYVYFIQGEHGGAIKIGVSYNGRVRLQHLQVGSPVKLKLLGLIAGGQRKEAELHERFALLQTHGEWFAPGQELIDFIQREATNP